MMPSAAKQQQQTVSKNGTTTTTTTVITNQSNFDNAKFTQAELGSRSFARTVEKNISDMNRKKGEASSIPLSEITPHDVSHIPDDLTFGSTSDANQLPQTVTDILAFHGIIFTEGDRVIHIPGAKYFSISKMEGEVKTYRTFSLDEDITPPESELEPTPETVSAESVISVVPEVTQPIQTDTVPDNLPVSQNISPIVPQSATTNTLGTISVSQSIETSISQPTVPENFMSQFASDQTSSSERSEPVKRTVNVPITEIPPTIQIPIVSQESISIESIKPKPVVMSSQKQLDLARIASNRERDAYYANRYINSITGTITELFGGNTSIQSELFKTVQDYNTARKGVLVEMGSMKKAFHEVVTWVKQEQIEIAHLFSHEKSQLFMKLAKVFHLSVPSIIETRTGAAPMVSQTISSVISQKLGLVEKIESGPAWNYLFEVERPVKLDFTKSATPIIPVTVQPVAPTPITFIETIPITEQPKKVDHAKLYTKLHEAIGSMWELGKKVEIPTHAIPVASEIKEQEIVPESIVSQEQPVVVSRPMAAISFQPEPEEVPVVDMNSSMKQHPEELFI
jgi:hypothetical protein